MTAPAPNPVTATLPPAGPYVLRDGEGLSHLVAGQVVRTIAGIEQTAGGFGAVVAECPLDRGPIPMHWHEREHDTWFVTRGRLQIWAADQSRVLTPGDFAYVPPRVAHSYRSVAPRTRFFGIVAPGGWEQFFADAGEVWGMTGLPPEGHPFDFSRMGPAMGKHRIMRVDAPTYVEATPIGDGDQQVPGGQSAYFLEAGFGIRHVLRGHLSTAVLTAAQSDGKVDMRVIEGDRGAAMPALRHDHTHVFLYMLDGQLGLTLDGEEHRLTGATPPTSPRTSPMPPASSAARRAGSRPAAAATVPPCGRWRGPKPTASASRATPMRMPQATVCPTSMVSTSGNADPIG